ncbi:MAG TPA: hypothetical protein VFU76_09445, partial [Terriglobales bacterium]|nr:hypothetical protein [Terriglobales bacterium]
KVEMDPRLKGVTIADLQKQFDLAMQIRDKVSQADEIVIAARELKKQIADRTGKVKNASLTTAAEKLNTKLSDIEETVYQVRNRSGQDPLNFPIKLNNLLAALQRSVSTDDYPPTDQAYVVFKELSQELADVQTRMTQVENTDVVAFNKVLAKEKLAAITTTAGTAAAK